MFERREGFLPSWPAPPAALSSLGGISHCSSGHSWEQKPLSLSPLHLFTLALYYLEVDTRSTRGGYLRECPRQWVCKVCQRIAEETLLRSFLVERQKEQRDSVRLEMIWSAVLLPGSLGYKRSNIQSYGALPVCQALCYLISFNPTDEGVNDQRSPQLHVLQTYSHLCGLLFCIQMQSFDGEKFLLLTQPHLLILSLKISGVCVLFKRSLLTRGYLLHYFEKIYCFTCRM